MKCCMKCDRKGNVFPTGQCVDPYDIDSECPLSSCNKRLIDVDEPMYVDSPSLFEPRSTVDFLGIKFVNYILDDDI